MRKFMILSAIGAAALMFAVSDTAQADHSRSRGFQRGHGSHARSSFGFRGRSCNQGFYIGGSRWSFSIGNRGGYWNSGRRGFNRGFDRHRHHNHNHGFNRGGRRGGRR